MKRLNIFWGILLSCVSCDSFLSETASDELIPESTQAFSELLLYEGYVSKEGCMNKITYYMDDDVENNYPESTYSSGYKDADLDAKLFYTWQPDAVNQVLNEATSAFVNTKGYVLWKDYYEYILGCNIILKYVDASIGTDLDKDYLKGEAYCLRAFHYFQLVNLYGWPYNDPRNDPKTSLGVPIITEPKIGELSFPRNTVEEVYDLIIEDIEHAVEYLDREKRISSKYRVSYLVAHLLASRIYLYMENWDKALEHARVVMNDRMLCDYTADQTGIVFRAENEDVLWMYGYVDNAWGVGTAYTSSAYVASNQLYALYDVDGLSDARKGYFFSADANNLVTVLKYSTSTKAYGQGLRATEAYLNAIEALLEQYKAGNSAAGTEALRLLNDFRTKRYIAIDGNGGTSIEMKSADELIEIYRLERRKELCYEGQRWFDLRRFGMPRIERFWSVDGISSEKYVLEEHDPMYVLEIPTYVTDYNSGIEPNEILPSERLPESL